MCIVQCAKCLLWALIYSNWYCYCCAPVQSAKGWQVGWRRMGRQLSSPPAFGSGLQWLSTLDTLNSGSQHRPVASCHSRQWLSTLSTLNTLNTGHTQQWLSTGGGGRTSAVIDGDFVDKGWDWASPVNTWRLWKPGGWLGWPDEMDGTGRVISNRRCSQGKDKWDTIWKEESDRS